MKNEVSRENSLIMFMVNTLTRLVLLYNLCVQLVDLRCPMDVLPFPFDEQLCSLQFGSWSYGTSQLHHVVKPSSIPDLVTFLFPFLQGSFPQILVF